MYPFEDVRFRGIAPQAESIPCAACPVREITVCGAFQGKDLHRMGSIAHIVRFDAGQTIFSEGECAEHVFNVTSGTIKLYKLLSDGRRQITGFLTPGDFLGLAMNEIYAYNAEAVTQTSLCRFSRRRIEALLDVFPKMQRRLFSMTSNELAAAQDQMLLLGRKTAKEKICTFLLMLSRRAARRGQRENPVIVPMCRTDIADYLGLTTETVSRTFTQLRTTGVILLEEGNRVRVVDMARLRDLAEGV